MLIHSLEKKLWRRKHQKQDARFYILLNRWLEWLKYYRQKGVPEWEEKVGVESSVWDLGTMNTKEWELKVKRYQDICERWEGEEVIPEVENAVGYL